MSGPRFPRYERWKFSCPSLTTCAKMLKDVVPADVCRFGKVAGEEELLEERDATEVRK